jgi:hypothetical protein
MIQTMTGGCQCGRVRYSVEADPAEAYLCHCKMCQRATGGVAAAFVGVQQADVEWHGEPDWFDSSPSGRSARHAARRWGSGSVKAAPRWT